MRAALCHGCWCWIVSASGDWAAIAAAVYRHNLTDLHVAWRLRGVA